MEQILTFKEDRNKTTDSIDQTFDRDWLKTTFIISDQEISSGDEYKKWIRKNRYVSSADYKFTCTAPGMNMAVNPKPQFTRYADIRSKGKITSRADITTQQHLTGEFGAGMGRYYSEAIDDNAQRIFLRFGVPKYMPLLFWMTKAFDINSAVMQNRGVISSALLTGVNIVSTVFAVVAAPLLAVGMFLANACINNNRFYSVNPTMYLYWAAVEDILNSLVTRRTLLPHILTEYAFKVDAKINQEQNININTVDTLNKLLPGIVDSKGRISVFALALKAQSIFNDVLNTDYEKGQSNNSSLDFTNYPLSGTQSLEGHDTYVSNKQGDASFFTKYLFRNAYELLGHKDAKTNISEQDKASIKNMTNTDPFFTTTNGELINTKVDPNKKETLDDKLAANVKAKKSTWDNYKEYLLAELSEGAAFAVFNVEHTGSVGESFSNSFMANPIEATFNSISSKARSVGNILSSATDFPIIGDVMSVAAAAAATVVSNSTFGIANPLLALMYGLNVEMPKTWESSSANLPRASYKIKLISPYGNPYSQLFNIYLPLSMLMAGSLPRSTGKSSHTSPFCCQLFDRGRVNISLGMIESLSITRGTSNLAFTKAGKPNAIDVDISIANMDNILSIDTPSGGLLDNVANLLNPDFSETPFTDYLNTITGLDIYHQVYKIPMMRLKIAERIMKAGVVTDPAALAAFTVDKLLFADTAKQILGNSWSTVVDATKGL